MILALNDSKSNQHSPKQNKAKNNQTQGAFNKERRSTVFSDSHSIDLVRANKPKFMNKSQRKKILEGQDVGSISSTSQQPHMTKQL